MPTICVPSVVSPGRDLRTGRPGQLHSRRMSLCASCERRSGRLLSAARRPTPRDEEGAAPTHFTGGQSVTTASAGRWRRGRRPALRRDHHRHGRGRRHARPPAGAVRQAGPDPRTRRLPAARARQLGLHRGVRQGQVPGAGVLVRPARPRVPAGGELLRRRQHQVLRRRAVPAAAGGLRRAAPPRRHLAGLADRLRGPGAVLHPGRAPLPGARPARRGPDRGAGQRAVPLSAGAARAADPAAQRRPGEAGPAPVPPADRRATSPRTSTAGPPTTASASAATGSTASRAWSTASPTPR